MFGSSNWSRLPGDVWFSIGVKLDDAADRVRFRAVSKSIRSHLPYRQPPWLMLSEFSEDEEKDDDVPPQRRFVVLGGQKFYKLDLVQAHLARYVGSTNTWLITLKRDIILRLLNPFSRVEIDLPDGLTFGDRYLEVKPLPPRDIDLRDTFLKRVIICPPSAWGGTNSLVIAIQERGKLAITRVGDSFWTTVKSETRDYNCIRDAVVYKGQLYAMTSWGQLISCEISDYPNPPIQFSPAAKEFNYFKVDARSLLDPDRLSHMLYLVEWSGHLLFVIKFINIFGKPIRGEPPITIPFYKTQRFQIYKLDFTNRNWIEIKSLGEYSLFLGFNTSVSVLASDYCGLVKKNCIYFTDDYSSGYLSTRTPAGYDMGIFDLEDCSIRPHYQGKSTCYYSPPIWIFPNSDEAVSAR